MSAGYFLLIVVAVILGVILALWAFNGNIGMILPGIIEWDKRGG